MEGSPIDSDSVALWVVWMTVCGDKVLTAAFRPSTLNGVGKAKGEVVLEEEEEEEGVRWTGLPRRTPPFSRCAVFSGLVLGGASWWSPWLLGISMKEVLSSKGSRAG